MTLPPDCDPPALATVPEPDADGLLTAGAVDAARFWPLAPIQVDVGRELAMVLLAGVTERFARDRAPSEAVAVRPDWALPESVTAVETEAREFPPVEAVVAVPDPDGLLTAGAVEPARFCPSASVQVDVGRELAMVLLAGVTERFARDRAPSEAVAVRPDWALPESVTAVETEAREFPPVEAVVAVPDPDGLLAAGAVEAARFCPLASVQIDVGRELAMVLLEDATERFARDLPPSKAVAVLAVRPDCAPPESVTVVEIEAESLPPLEAVVADDLFGREPAEAPASEAP